MSDKRRIPPLWIDHKLVQTSLQLGNEDPELSVTSFAIEPAIGVGENYGSDMFRVSAKLEGDKSVSIIIKIPPQGLNEAFMEKAAVFQRESTMYIQILVKMFQLLDESAPGQYQPFFAKCLHSGLKPLTFMVLEDLSVSGFRNAQRQKGLDLDHCLLVMQNLARFHASSVALYKKHPDLFDIYKKSIFTPEMLGMIVGFLKLGLHSVTEELGKCPEFERYVDKLLKFPEVCCDLITDKMRHREGKMNVLLHGDLWVNNIMFKYSDKDLVDLKFVDFPQSTLTSPAFDLHYFINTSANEEVQAKYLDQLLIEYQSTLNTTLSLLGCEDCAMTLEELHRELDENVFYALLAAITVLPLVLADPADGKEIQDSMEGLVEGEALPPNKMYTNKLYLSIIKRMLPELEAKGCFKGL